MRTRAVLVGAIAVVLAACSGGETTGDEVEAGAPTSTVAATPAPNTEPAVGWSVERLPGPIGGAVRAAVADGAMVLAAGLELGSMEVWVDRGDGFEDGDGPDGLLFGPSAIAAVPGGFVLAARTDDGRAELWRTDDGRTWQPAPDLLPPGDVDVSDLLFVEDALVAAGLRYTSDTEAQPFDPAMWLIDQDAPTDVTLAASIGTVGYGFVADVEVVGDRLLAVGADADRPAVWWSTDGGRSWVPGDLPGAFVEPWAWLTDLAVSEDRLLVSSTIEDDLAVRWSDDGGATWAAAADLGDGLSAGSIDVADGSFWIVGSRFHGFFEDLERCYVELTGCDEPEPVVLRSEDGETWVELDLPDELAGQVWPQLVVERGDELSIIGRSRAGEALVVLTWRADDDPPTRPVSGTPTDDGPRFVRWDAELVVGETVRFPLYTHCGIGVLGGFNGRSWFLEGSPGGLPSPAPDETWPMVGESVLGLATLVDDETIEYSLPSGEVVGTYVASDDEPFSCD